MTHVVERCPSCGVEHEGAQVGACEACQAPLRYWCRRHGRDAGWLEAAACPRCVEEAALPRPLAPVVPAEPAIPLAMFGRTIHGPAPQRAEAAPAHPAPAPPAPKPESVLFSLATLPVTVTVICTFFALWIGVVEGVAMGGGVASVLGWGKIGLIGGAGLGILADVFYLIGKLSENPK
ncbi:MAG TPA: hypothetical protein VGX50_03900 [Longimicrobium sp.]|jgi:hypothetical protein|nr:hypothetical protein [Longimicrobium sp.]